MKTLIRKLILFCISLVVLIFFSGSFWKIIKEEAERS